MTSQAFRSATGGVRIDRTRPLSFSFNGKRYSGFEGDTLASGLLANGVRVGGRSFKYHRPRGLLAAGVEEPNVLVEIGAGGRKTTNLRATEVPLSDGLEAWAVNVWPGLRFDIGAINGLFSRFLKAGFYYKTFMWPHWHAYEGVIRRAAGIGRPSKAPDPDCYEHQHAHCDVLVVGAGETGAAAAREAAKAGANVLLVEQDAVSRELSAALGEKVTVLGRATAIGCYDHNLVVVAERIDGPEVRERLWQVRARRVVLATGAFERPLLFPGNDRPGVMLASAARRYLDDFAVLPGRNVIVATNNDGAYEMLSDLLAAGVHVRAIVDTRTTLTSPTHPSDLRVLKGADIKRVLGRSGVTAIDVCDGAGGVERIACDAVLMSGGWNPDAQLFSQAGGALHYDKSIASFRPTAPLDALCCAGAASGCFDRAFATIEGEKAGLWAAGKGDLPPSGSRASDHGRPAEPIALPQTGESRTFVDFQNDVTVADIRLAAQENFVSVEHLKRYTTLGMAVDQGKTSGINALALMGLMTGRSPGDVGTTRFRPPYVPTTVSAFAGPYGGEIYKPFKQTPLHGLHEHLDARFEELGGWLRPAYYARPGEDREAALRREALAVRNRAGLFDASPLGKIEVCGPDAATFLDRIYANRMSTLAVGRARYGLMLNELGVIVDDGVTARMAEDRFLVGTTSGGADRIAAVLEEWLQCEWRDLRVVVAPVTSLWGNVTLAGPAARGILERAGCSIPLGDALPYLGWREADVAGLRARIARVSFTGELSYEISVHAPETERLWASLEAAAAEFGGAEPVGIDAWMLLRLEKGFIHVGADTEGTTVPDDIGWSKVATRSGDFIGKRSLLWDANRAPGRLQLVGLEAVGEKSVLPIGAHFESPEKARRSDGFVTSSAYSPTLDRPVALGLVRAGRQRYGEKLKLIDGCQTARIVEPVFYDKAGERLNA